MVLLAAQEILGIDPRDGSIVWSRSLSTDPGMAFCSTPVWDAATQTLVLRCVRIRGNRPRITVDGRETKVEPLWHNNGLQSLFSNLLLIDDTIYLSRGFSGPPFLTAVDVKTGKTKWSTREFAKASFLRPDGELNILDEDGWLALAKPNGTAV